MSGLSFKKLIAQAAESGDLDVEGAKIDFALCLSRVLRSNQLSKAELAARLNVSKPLVSRMLRGDANLTIETMVKAAKAAGGKLHLHVSIGDQAIGWLDVIGRAPSHRRGVAQSRLLNSGISNNHQWNPAANDNEAQPVAA